MQWFSEVVQGQLRCWGNKILPSNNIATISNIINCHFNLKLSMVIWFQTLILYPFIHLPLNGYHVIPSGNIFWICSPLIRYFCLISNTYDVFSPLLFMLSTATASGDAACCGWSMDMNSPHSYLPNTLSCCKNSSNTAGSFSIPATISDVDCTLENDELDRVHPLLHYWMTKFWIPLSY